MVFRPNYPFSMYPGAMRMRMPMQMPMQQQMPMQMPMQQQCPCRCRCSSMPMQMRMPMQMPPQSYMPPNGFPFQQQIPGGLQMPGGLGAMGGQIPGAAAGAPMQPPSKIASFFQSADSLFNSAKTYTPYIQQAMPMMKNIPSLFKLYKGFSGLPAADAVAGAGAAAVAADVLGNNGVRARRSASQVAPSIPREPIPSRPRIFQPPM